MKLEPRRQRKKRSEMNCTLREVTTKFGSRVSPSLIYMLHKSQTKAYLIKRAARLFVSTGPGTGPRASPHPPSSPTWYLGTVTNPTDGHTCAPVLHNQQTPVTQGLGHCTLGWVTHHSPDRWTPKSSFGLSLPPSLCFSFAARVPCPLYARARRATPCLGPPPRRSLAKAPPLVRGSTRWCAIWSVPT